MPNTVEHAGEKGRVSDDLKGRLSRGRVCSEWREADVHSWSCHDQVLNEGASGEYFGGQGGHEECEILENGRDLE